MSLKQDRGDSGELLRVMAAFQDPDLKVARSLQRELIYDIDAQNATERILRRQFALRNLS